MINRIKSFIAYIIIFAASVTLLTGLLLASARIPRSRIQKNMEKSADILCEHNRIWYMIPGVESSQNHLYADAITVNIVYHLDDENLPESVMWARYYNEDGDVNTSLRTSVYEQLPGKTQYLRYWHGSAAVVRFLHLFWNIREIYWLHAFIVAGLLAGLLALLVRNKLLTEAAGVLFSMCMVSVWFVPFCLEYTWTFLCMLVVSIISVKLALVDERGKLGFLFLITGIITVYLDFLSTETLTLVVPLILALRVTEGKNGDIGKIRSSWLFTLKSSLLWTFGYVGMWVSKWLIASAVLHENVMPYVRDHISDRIGTANPTKSMPAFIIGSILRNVKCLLPFDYGIFGAALLLGMILAFIVLPVVMDKVAVKEVIDTKMIALYLIVGAIPILRFAVLRNHSWYHRSFTYRALAGTLLALCCVVAEIVKRKDTNAHS